MVLVYQTLEVTTSSESRMRLALCIFLQDRKLQEELQLMSH